MNVACQVAEAAAGRCRRSCASTAPPGRRRCPARDAPRYWALIDAFREVTGVPVLLNTSFNLRGEPIVHTPRNAVRDFLFSSLDVLVLESFLVVRDVQS